MIYDKVIDDWFNPKMKNVLDASIKTESSLFIKDGNNAKPSTLLYDELRFKFDYLENYFKKMDNGFAGDNAKPLSILNSNLDKDKYGYPKIPEGDSPVKYNGIYSFNGDLMIDFNPDMHLDDIKKIRIIHGIKNSGDRNNYVFSGIYLDKNAWKLSRFNLELINQEDKILISKPIGSKIFKTPENHENPKIKNQRKERIFTEINLDK